MVVVAAIVSPILHKSKHLCPFGIRSHITVVEEFILATRKLAAPSERPRITHGRRGDGVVLWMPAIRLRARQS
jgi:hypothetical protein